MSSEITIDEWQINLKQESPDKKLPGLSDPKGIRTPITAVKGRGPNH